MRPILTYREVAVLSMVGEGCDNEQIAAYLYLKTREVNAIVRDCVEQLRANDPQEAVEHARELKLIGTGRVVA